tara:strand:+ start:4595 stop:5161 length:567 start_codon:yes stop_codon:yes gene_type:complete
MHKLNERLSPIQRRNVKINLDRSLSRRGNIDRGSGMSPIALQRARTKRDTSLSRKGNIQRSVTHEKEYGQQLASTDTGMSAYNKLFEMLTENTPSKTELAAKKALGWDIRPEDEPGIPKAFKRIRVRRRKGQTSASIMSTSGQQKLKRRLKSSVFSTETEQGAIQHNLKARVKRAENRKKQKEAEKEK